MAHSVKIDTKSFQIKIFSGGVDQTVMCVPLNIKPVAISLISIKSKKTR